MEEFLARTWREILARPSGPMALRFYLQPVMAALLALRQGIKDAQAGRPAYLWACLTDPLERKNLLRDGWRSVGKIFILSYVLDTIYQLVVLRGVRPVQGLFVATALAVAPYLLFRGPANRVVRAFMQRNRSARA